MDDLELTLEKIAAKRNLLKALKNAVNFKGTYGALKGRKGIAGIGKKSDQRLNALLTLLGVGTTTGTAGYLAGKEASLQAINDELEMEKIAGFADLMRALKGTQKFTKSGYKAWLKKTGKKATDKTLAQYQKMLGRPFKNTTGTAIGVGAGLAGLGGGAGYLAGKEAALQLLADELAMEKSAGFADLMRALKGTQKFTKSGYKAWLKKTGKKATDKTLAQYQKMLGRPFKNTTGTAIGVGAGLAGLGGGAGYLAGKEASLQAINDELEMEKIAGFADLMRALKGTQKFTKSGYKAWLKKTGKKATDKTLAQYQKMLGRPFKNTTGTAIGVGAGLAGLGGGAGYLAGKEAALQDLAEELIMEKMAASLYEEDDDDFDLSDLL